RRHEEGGAVETRAARVVGLGVGRVLEVNEPHAAGAERGGVLGAIEGREPEHVAVEAGDPVEVAHPQAHRAAVERSAAGDGRWGVRLVKVGVAEGFGALIRAISTLPERRAIALSSQVAVAKAALLGSLSLVRLRSARAPCPSTPPPSAASRISRALRLPRMRSSTCGGSSMPSLPSCGNCRKATSGASSR